MAGAKKGGAHGGGGSGYTLEVIIVGLVILGLAVYALFPGIFQTGAGTITADANSFLFRISHAVLRSWTHWMAPVFIFLDIVLVSILFFAMYKFWHFRTPVSLFERPSIIPRGHKPKKNPQILKRWTEIVKKANTGTPENMRLAVIDADALVDFYLKSSGYEGETMADRLSDVIADEVPSIERVWKAHKLRNELVHTPELPLTAIHAKEALLAYRDFLKQLDAF